MQKKKKICIGMDILLGMPKTIFFNFKYLPIKQAVKLPIIISNNCKFIETHGKITIESDRIATGMILWGIGSAAIIDKYSNKSIIELGEHSDIHFMGQAKMGYGVKLSSDGILILGDKVSFTGNSIIVCKKRISIGADTIISWNTQIMDTDIHEVLRGGIRTNFDNDILIGEHVWVGCNTNIYKGTCITNGSVVAADSVIKKGNDSQKMIYGGVPERVIADNIEWRK